MKAQRGSTKDAAVRTRDDIPAAVLCAARRGDHAAFTEIVDRYEPHLRALVCHVIQDRDQVEDVLQDALLRAYRALPAFRGNAALGTWLHRIAYTTSLEHARRRARLREAPESAAAERASSAPDMGDDLALREVVARALTALSAEQRLTLLLVDREGLDYREVAAIMGVSAGTVCSRLVRARARLRMALVAETATATVCHTEEES